MCSLGDLGVRSNIESNRFSDGEVRWQKSLKRERLSSLFLFFCYVVFVFVFVFSFLCGFQFEVSYSIELSSFWVCIVAHLIGTSPNSTSTCFATLVNRATSLARTIVVWVLFNLCDEIFLYLSRAGHSWMKFRMRKNGHIVSNSMQVLDFRNVWYLRQYISNCALLANLWRDGCAPNSFAE